MRIARAAAAIGAATLSLLVTSVTLACTTIALGPSHRPVVVYSFDYEPTGVGLLIVNPEHGRRQSILESPARWTIRHGSVTVNQMGPGMPVAGMNTAGLVVSLMWNDEVTFGGGASLPVLGELEFIQRLLDTSATVEEAIGSVSDVRIGGFVPVHYFLADATGASAVLTPTTDGVRVHAGRDLPVPALTNTSYAELSPLLNEFAGFGGERALPDWRSGDAPGSRQRFLIAAAASLEKNPVTVKDAYDVLASVANATTRWQLVFEPVEQRITLRLTSGQGPRTIRFGAIDFSCRETPLAAGLQSIQSPDLSDALVEISPLMVSRVSRQVLATLDPAAGLGPQLADGLTHGLLASLACEP